MKRKAKLLACAATAAVFAPIAASAQTVTLAAAGSLEAALGELASNYATQYKTTVKTRFGPSGLLRKGIEEGDRPELFASANMAHPERLAATGWGGPVVLFARNQLCALVQPELEVSSDTLLDALLRPDLRVGTSTPKADPSGDYAWALFEKAEKLRPGSFALLSGKALQLTGGAESDKAPEGTNQYGWVMAGKKADLFLTYCTNAVLARKEVPALRIVRVPEALSVGADYGLVVRSDASGEAWRLALYILSPAGQKTLSDYGFEAAAMPR